MSKSEKSAAAPLGPLGKGLFGESEAAGLERVAVVDVGSNSVRLVIFDGAARIPAYFYNEKIMCALGAGMAISGRLNPEGRKRALAALKRFEALARGIGVPLTVVATAAVREAEDGPDFCAEVQRETGIGISVIDGHAEALFSAQGVMLGWPGSRGMVCDIGGSSMELAEIADGEVGRRESVSMGPLKMRDIVGGRKTRKKLIRETIEMMREKLGKQEGSLFLVGGSWRAIAKLDMLRRDYPLHVIHEYRMTLKAVRKTVKFIRDSDPQKLSSRADISTSRMELIPYAAEVLVEVLDVFKPKDVAVSSYGMREGLLYEQMPQSLRARDPLIEACRFAERQDARIPGHGHAVHEFVKPLFKSAPESLQRLVEAVCLLHDVGWRAHPDVRAEDCFNNAVRANLGGVEHAERVFLGLALLYRYTNRREGTRFESLAPLMKKREVRQAEILGKAVRFATMLDLREDASPGELIWRRKKKKLEIRLEPENRALFGEVAQARFSALADTLGAEAVVDGA